MESRAGTARLVRHSLTVAVGASVIATVAGGTAAIVVVVRAPPLREALIAIEPTLSSLLFFGALLVALWRWRGQRSGARRAFRRFEARAGYFLSRWGWALALLCMLAPLLGQWALRPPAGTTALAALLGYVPWSDARGHLEGGVRLLSEGAFGPFSERRPLNAAWLAVELALSGGRLPIVLVLQALLTGFAAYLLARVVGWRFGLASALATFGLVQGLARDYIPAELTEPLAISLGCVALALLVAHQTRGGPMPLALGLFGFGVALGARPGPQLLLLTLLLWAAWVVRRAGRWAVVSMVLAMALAFASAIALSGLYGAGASSTTGSGAASSTSFPAYALYSLASNTNCDLVERTFERELAGRSPRAAASVVYRRAAALLWQDPRPFAHALADNTEKFGSKLGANLSRIATLRALFAPSIEHARPSVPERRLNLLWGLPFLLAVGLASGVWLRRRAPLNDRLLWLAVGSGVLVSIPFVYGISGFRSLAAAYPCFALFFALGLASRRPLPRGAAALSGERAVVMSAACLPLAIVALSLCVPALAHRVWPRPEAQALVGLAPGRTLLLTMDYAPAVLVSRAPRAGLAHVPWVRERELNELLDLAEFRDAELRSLRLPFVVASVYDFVTKSQYLLIGPVDLLRQRGFVHVDVEPLGDSGAIVRDTRLALEAAAPNPVSDPQ